MGHQEPSGYLARDKYCNIYPVINLQADTTKKKVKEEEVKDGADDPMQLTTCLLRCHSSCNCRRENVVIIAAVVVVDDRQRRQGSTLFEKTKHRNTAAYSQVP